MSDTNHPYKPILLASGAMHFMVYVNRSVVTLVGMTTRMKSINPWNNELLAEYEAMSNTQLDATIELCHHTSRLWKDTSLASRCDILVKTSEILLNRRSAFARLMALEMGKPIEQGLAEIDKCAWVCRHYAEHASGYLQSEHIKTEALSSYVRHDAIGMVLGIMPWNYPFWQVFRFAAPTLVAGNTVALKHASNVQGCARAIEHVIAEAGFPDHVFVNLAVSAKTAGLLIADSRIRAVSLTGGGPAGTSVASKTGAHLKKSVLELGGSNSFIVLADADLQAAAKTAAIARMQNSGQSCIAAKRIIIHHDVYDKFVRLFVKALENLPYGDPLEHGTYIGPVARPDLAEELQAQMLNSAKMGAVLQFGGEVTGARFKPALLTHVEPGMPAFEQETFGPLAVLCKVENETQALDWALASDYGLGDSIYTSSRKSAEFFIRELKGGAVFVNQLVKSDPRLPIGGTGISGYGRELGRDGIMEFINRKTVWVDHYPE